MRGGRQKEVGPPKVFGGFAGLPTAGSGGGYVPPKTKGGVGRKWAPKLAKAESETASAEAADETAADATAGARPSGAAVGAVRRHLASCEQ